MPMWTCDFANCKKPAVRTLGDCVLCNRHFCSYHLQDAFHACPKWEVSSALHDINLGYFAEIDDSVGWDERKSAALHRYREDAGLLFLLSK